MFEASLLDMRSGSRRRGCTTILSFSLQALGVGLLIIAPLFYTEALPIGVWLGPQVVAPSGPQEQAPASAKPRDLSVVSEVVDGTIREPRGIPEHIAPIDDEAPPAPMGQGGVGVPGAPPGAGGPGTLLDSILKPPPVMAGPAPQHSVFRSSHFTEGMLIVKVQPIYPPPAIRARIQGTVLLRALIGRDGRIKELDVLSGHPWLSAAAVEGVKQWRYRPYYLNGEPVDVETQVTVNFKLAGE